MAISTESVRGLCVHQQWKALHSGITSPGTYCSAGSTFFLPRKEGRKQGRKDGRRGCRMLRQYLFWLAAKINSGSRDPDSAPGGRGGGRRGRLRVPSPAPSLDRYAFLFAAKVVAYFFFLFFFFYSLSFFFLLCYFRYLFCYVHTGNVVYS